MNTSLKVSIIMPTFNIASLVSETINSVLSQTYTNWELLIIDDYSSDGTPLILKEFEQSESRIKVVYSKKNYGAGVSRNIGLEIAQGRFIAFLDSDDIWQKDKLSKQVAHMLLNNAAISHTSFSFIGEDGEQRAGYVKASESVDLLHHLKFTEIGTSTAIIDTQLVKEKFSFSEIRARQDLKLWIELLSLGYISKGLNLPLVKYRVRAESVSSNKIKMILITFDIYMKLRILPLKVRLICYFSYINNALAKRKNK